MQLVDVNVDEIVEKLADELMSRSRSRREHGFNNTQPLYQYTKSSAKERIQRNQKSEQDYPRYLEPDPADTKTEDGYEEDAYRLELHSADGGEDLPSRNDSKPSKLSHHLSKGRLDNQSSDSDGTRNRSRSRHQTTSDNKFRDIMGDYQRSEDKEDFDIKYTEY